MKTIDLLNKKYEVIHDEKDALDLEELTNRVTDYFTDFDFIVGDWAYGKLRLKGFNLSDNPNFKEINDASNINEYLKTNCAYGCRYFIIKQIRG